MLLPLLVLRSEMNRHLAQLRGRAANMVSIGILPKMRGRCAEDGLVPKRVFLLSRKAHLMKNGDGYLSTSIHIRVLFGPQAGHSQRGVARVVSRTPRPEMDKPPDRALPLEIVSKCREPSRRVYYGAA